jgi:hypothetical protein
MHRAYCPNDLVETRFVKTFCVPAWQIFYFPPMELIINEYPLISRTHF